MPQDSIYGDGETCAGPGETVVFNNTIYSPTGKVTVSARSLVMCNCCLQRSLLACHDACAASVTNLQVLQTCKCYKPASVTNLQVLQTCKCYKPASVTNLQVLQTLTAVQECGVALKEWQAKGHDVGTTASPWPEVGGGVG